MLSKGVLPRHSLPREPGFKDTKPQISQALEHIRNLSITPKGIQDLGGPREAKGEKGNIGLSTHINYNYNDLTIHSLGHHNEMIFSYQSRCRIKRTAYIFQDRQLIRWFLYGSE